MVLSKNIKKGKKKKLEKNNRWKNLRDIHYVPKSIKTSLDYKKQKFNSKEAKALLDEHQGKNIKNITKKFKNFGFRREREVIGYKIGKNKNKIPVYKSTHTWNPSTHALDAIPDLKFEKKRFMYAKDTDQPLSYMLLTKITEVKRDIHKLKRGQPKRGFGLITKNDLDKVFGKNVEYNQIANVTTKNNNTRDVSKETLKSVIGQFVDMLSKPKPRKRKKGKKKKVKKK